MLLRFTKGRESAILFGGNRRIPLCWHKWLEWLAKIDANDLPGDRLLRVRLPAENVQEALFWHKGLKTLFAGCAPEYINTFSYTTKEEGKFYQ